MRWGTNSPAERVVVRGHHQEGSRGSVREQCYCLVASGGLNFGSLWKQASSRKEGALTLTFE